MYFDFYDDRPDYLAINRDVARLEDLLHLIVAVSAAFFLDIVALIVLMVIASMPASDAAKRAALANAHKDEPTRFVFMAPRIDTPALKAPPNAEPSDKNRAAQSRERSPNPTNPLPFSRGNTFERVDEPSTPPPRQRAEVQPQPADADTQRPGQSGQNGQNAQNAPALTGPPLASARGGLSGALGAPGSLAAALGSPFRYAQGDAFNNPGGEGGQTAQDIQFDSKGVEFGPWLQRFIAQLKRNWLIPMAAMTMKGHVVITFYVYKDGTIGDIQVQEPCPVVAFNRAAQGALISSNPTHPLPPEYPADRCFFAVTFYYNEMPPNR
jgi:outer membrane biosynthesis protein TonB